MGRQLQKKILVNATFLAAATTVAACTKTPPLSSELKSEVPAVANQHVYPLGTGFLSLFGEFYDGQSCVTAAERVDGKPVFEAAWAPEASLDAGYAETQTRSEHRLRSGAEVNGKVDIGVAALTVDGRIEIETALVDHELKTSVYTTFTNRAGNVVLVNPALTSFGKALASGDDLVDKVERLFSCGDEFVYQVQLGNRLSLGLEFAFASKEVKNNFNLKVDGGAKVAGKKIKRTFLEVDENFNFESIIGTVRLIFEQEGGNRELFEQAKASVPTDCHVAGGFEAEVNDQGIGVKKGVLRGYETCIEAYQRLMSDYAVNSFPAQVKGLEYAAKSDLANSGYTALRYYTMAYEKAGYPEFRSVLKDLPTEIQEFLDKKVKPLVMALKKLMKGLRALDNVLENTSRDPVVVTVKGKLGQALGGADGPLDEAAMRALADGARSLKGQTQATLTSCRQALIQAVKTDVKATARAWPTLKGEISECSAELDELMEKIAAFNVKLTGSN